MPSLSENEYALMPSISETEYPLMQCLASYKNAHYW